MRRNSFYHTIGVAALIVMTWTVCVGQEPTHSAAVNDLAQAAEWLQATSQQLIRDSRRRMTDGVAAFPPQAGAGYEAFWLRDYAYMLEGCPEAFSEQELRDACRLFVKSLRRDGAAVDCVKFDGTAIYQPGYGTMGANPVADGSMFMVDVAWHTHQRLKDREFLGEIIDRLVATIEATPRNPKTGLVYIDPTGMTAALMDLRTRCGSKGMNCSARCCSFRPIGNWLGLLAELDRNAEAKRFLEDEQRLGHRRAPGILGRSDGAVSGRHAEMQTAGHLGLSVCGLLECCLERTNGAHCEVL